MGCKTVERTASRTSQDLKRHRGSAAARLPGPGVVKGKGKISMKPKAACYTVVENAGYEGEHDVRTAFSTPEAAWRWAERTSLQ
jgi:hypothetical protein